MYYRDIVYSYARGAAVDDKTFNLYWKDIAFLSLICALEFYVLMFSL